MELRRISLERYKGYGRRVEVDLAPLTILVGPNNSGKTALAQAIQLLPPVFATCVVRGTFSRRLSSPLNICP